MNVRFVKLSFVIKKIKYNESNLYNVVRKNTTSVT